MFKNFLRVPSLIKSAVVLLLMSNIDPSNQAQYTGDRSLLD